MSENERTSRPGPEIDLAGVGLTDSDLDRALARSVERGARLVRRRNQRRAAFSGLGIVVLLAGGFGVLHSLTDGGGSDVVVTPQGNGSGKVLAPGESTTTTPPVPTTTVPVAPIGFTRTEMPNGVILLTNDHAPDQGSVGGSSDGAHIDTAAAQDRMAAVHLESSGPTWVTVRYECTGATNHVDRVLFRRDGTVVTVQVVMVAAAAEPPCDSQSKTLFELSFPAADVPTDVSVVAGVLEG